MLFPIALLCLGLLPLTGLAQWTRQHIPLNPGWNSVFLLVQPEPADCDGIFATVPFAVESVRTYRQEFSTVQFISNPAAEVDVAPQWLTWLPDGSEVAFDRDLHILRCGRAYFLKLADDASPVTWELKGKAQQMPLAWRSDAFNLVGFGVNPGVSPTFGDFFAHSPAHANQPIFRMNAQGNWAKVTSPALTPMRGGEAFWIYMAADSSYQAPIRVSLPQGRGLDYGRLLSEETIEIRNEASTARSVQVSVLASESPAPGSGDTGGAGPVPLSYWDADVTNGTFDWIALEPGTPVGRLLQPGAAWNLRLRVRRKDMVPFIPPLGENYRSLIEVVEVDGPSIHTLPVVARGMEVFDEAGDPVHPYTGLWVGYARINEVSQPARGDNPDTEAVDESTQPLPVSKAANEFSFRIILHVDRNGEAALLSRVIQMWKDGTLKPDPADPARNILDQPGRFVWLSNPALASQFSGATLQDGDAVGRRISASAFGFDAPVPLAGAGNFGSTPRTCVLSMGADDTLNPYKHKYHPDHDNVGGEEAFPFSRELTFDFTADDPEGLALSGWCDTILGGLYKETIIGMHRDDIFVEGVFRINRVTRVAQLNDGQPH